MGRVLVMDGRWRWNVPAKALRDHSEEQVAQRLWERLDEELPVARAASSRRLWVPLAAAATFLCGVWVGGNYFAAVRPATPATALHAEPSADPRGVLAGGVGRENHAQPAVESKPRPRRFDQRPAAPLATAESVETEELVGPSADLGAAGTTSFSAVPLTQPIAPSWQTLAELGKYDAALMEIHRAGGFDAALGTANSEQLMLLVDVARATGQRPLAILALRRVVEQHKVDPLAPLAAWSLGVMLEKEGDRGGAAAAYGVYRALSPRGDFAEDALARQVRIASDSGERELSANLAREYVTLYPSSPRAEEYRAHLSEIEQAAQDQTSSDEQEGEETEGAQPSAGRHEDVLPAQPQP